MIRKAKGWCRQAERIDAEEYYRGEIVNICKKIKQERAYRQAKGNGGFGFVTFQSNL